METAAVFNAASLVGMKAAALLLISDVISNNKSLFYGRTEQDRGYYRFVRETSFSKIVLDTLTDERLY
jgi:purine-nucleoside phosphorylase